MGFEHDLMEWDQKPFGGKPLKSLWLKGNGEVLPPRVNGASAWRFLKALVEQFRPTLCPRGYLPSL